MMKSHKIQQYSFATFDIFKDYYEILDIDKEASVEQIKSNFYQLAKLYHPDKNPNNIHHFKLINEAYHVLSNEIERSDYNYQKFQRVRDTCSSENKTIQSYESNFQRQQQQPPQQFKTHGNHNTPRMKIQDLEIYEDYINEKQKKLIEVQINGKLLYERQRTKGKSIDQLSKKTSINFDDLYN